MRRPRLTGTNHDRWLWVGLGTATALAAGGLIETAHWRKIARDPERELLTSPPAGRAQTARSADGTEIHVEVFGPDAGPTVVLVHGWTEALQYWVYAIRALSKRGFRVVAYDQRGHGSSEPARGGDYSIERFGEDLEAVLGTCVPPGQLAIIAGHSLGAMSIAAWAEHHDVERRVRAAALLSTGVGDLIAEQLLLPLPSIAHTVNRAVSLYGFLGNRAPLPRYSTPLSYAAVRYIAFGRHASPAQVAFFERMLVTTPPDVRAKIGIAMSEMDLRHAVPRITVPTTVLVGADDRLTPPSHSRRIAAHLPHLERLVVLPETGHMTPLERPEEVTAALVDLATVTAERVVV